jgi:hypothetical protein
LLGFYFGRDLPLLERLISGASIGVLIAAGLVILGFLLIKRRRGTVRTTGEKSKVEGARDA